MSDLPAPLTHLPSDPHLIVSSSGGETRRQKLDILTAVLVPAYFQGSKAQGAGTQAERRRSLPARPLGQYDMGRKANPLIGEFFARGQKLNDQSNRYEHTCKACGMHFPRGRPDGMNRHLFEKCPNITDQDRARAYAFAQSQLDPKKIAQRFGNDPPLSGTPAASISQSGVTPAIEATVTGSASPGPQVDTGNIQREPSALDTLAEVSRQHLDISRSREQGEVPSQTQAGGQDDEGGELDSWMIQLKQHLHEANKADSRIDRNDDGQRGAQESVAVTADANSAASVHPSSTSDNTLISDLGTAIHPASAAMGITNIDPLLQSVMVEASQQAQHSGYDVNHERDPPAEYMSTVANGDGFGVLARPQARQKRNRFSVERRKEVGGIRKLGACLRCRMLKKPCSGDTPCSTCQVVGNPRLWRVTCIRTRIADELSLYNTSYFYSRARSAVIAAGNGVPPVNLQGRVDIRLGNDTHHISFPAMNLTGQQDCDLENLFLSFALDTDLAIQSIDGYFKSALGVFISFEESDMVLSTIGGLQSHLDDKMVMYALHIFAATTVLCSEGTLPWKILYVVPDEDGQTETPHLLSDNRSDSDVLKSQLLDATERFAASRFKLVANELERRLLARVTTTNLTTCLVSVLLLTCVGRMARLFRTFDRRERTSAQQEDVNGSPPDWPLSKEPIWYVRQAHSFDGLLEMLLHIRNLVPQTVVLDNDVLAVIAGKGQYISLVSPYGTDEDATGENVGGAFSRGVATWLQHCGMSASRIKAMAEMTDDDLGEDWTGWDARFVASMILPDATTGQAFASRGTGGGSIGSVDPVRMAQQAVAGSYTS